ncbi:MAG: hypothetical protein ABL908_12850 [Hyphomicrobium sp.]
MSPVHSPTTAMTPPNSTLDEGLTASIQHVAAPDNAGDMVVTLRVSGNALVRILNAAQVRATYHGSSELLALIDAAREVLADQRRQPAPAVTPTRETRATDPDDCGIVF